MNNNTEDVRFVKLIVESLVDFPEKIEIERKIDEMGVLLVLKVDQRDMGKIIGKKGTIVGAIRTLLRALGRRLKAIINLKVYEPEGMENKKRYGYESALSGQDTKNKPTDNSDYHHSDDPTNVGDLVK